jgi:aminobenzoyl-glutamate utilization protein B
MMVAAKTMALTAVDLLEDPARVTAAREEFERRRGTFVYKPRIGDRPPPLDYRKD